MKKVIIFILSLINFSFVHPQQFQNIANSSILDSLVVDSILIVGNKKTKDFVILREMSLQPGNYITNEAVEYDKKRIYSLQLFNSVEIYHYSINSPKTNLIVDVHERWYIYPFPIIGIKDRDWDKLYYGAGIINLNFRGRNEKIYTIGTLGYEPSIYLYFRNPQIKYWDDVFVETSIGYWKGNNKSPLAKGKGENFSENHFVTGLTIGKRYGIPHTIWGSLFYETVTVTENKPDRLLNPWGKDAFPIFSVGYNYDTRDLSDYSFFGTLINVKASKYGLFQHNIDYWRFNADYRRFIPLVPRVVLAGRLFSSISSGPKIPYYNHVYFGYTERIRGHFYKLYEGENIFGSSAEFRIILIEPQNYYLDFIPIPEFSVWKFGLVAAIFGDAGTTWFKNETPALDKFKKGYGTGLHFLLPYSFVFRFEYGLNEVGRGEIMLDISATF